MALKNYSPIVRGPANLAAAGKESAALIFFLLFWTNGGIIPLF